MIHIFVDDSGALYEPNETVVTVVALVVRDPEPLRWVIRRVRRDVLRKRSSKNLPAEFKFWNTSDVARTLVLSALAKESIQICALSAYKGQQRIADTPENYAVLLCALLERCLPASSAVQVVMDVHFSQREKQTRLGNLAQSALRLESAPHFVDSKGSPFVQLADFVAGAVRYARSGRSATYYQFIQPKIVGDELRTRKELKREWLERVWRKQKE